jgi:hypothetical protein
MRSAFSKSGRFAFARGNSQWARYFNQNLQARRYSALAPGVSIAPSTWRILSASCAMIQKMPILFAASELPASNGFAEQFGCSDGGVGNICSPQSEEISENGDEITEGLSSTQACSHVSLIKSLSDVIVFGTNWCNEMGKDYRLQM